MHVGEITDILKNLCDQSILKLVWLRVVLFTGNYPDTLLKNVLHLCQLHFRIIIHNG